MMEARSKLFLLLCAPTWVLHIGAVPGTIIEATQSKGTIFFLTKRKQLQETIEAHMKSIFRMQKHLNMLGTLLRLIIRRSMAAVG